MDRVASTSPSSLCCVLASDASFFQQAAAAIGTIKRLSATLRPAIVAIDLAKPEVLASVRDSQAGAGALASVRLIPAASPGEVAALAKSTPRRWSLVFIDGNHEVWRGDVRPVDRQPDPTETWWLPPHLADCKDSQ